MAKHLKPCGIAVQNNVRSNEILKKVNFKALNKIIPDVSTLKVVSQIMMMMDWIIRYVLKVKLAYM